MNRSMINASNTMTQLQHQLDLISHNMSNVNTTGYKRQEANFSDMLYQQFDNQLNIGKENGRNTPYGIRQGVGAKLAHTNIQTNQGALKKTERLLDVALTKENFFFKVLVNENGRQAVRYTRDGSFHLASMTNNRFMLTDSQGNAILDQNNKPIVVQGPIQNIRIEPNGNVAAVSANGDTPNQVFELGVVQVKRPHLLQGAGNNLFGLPDLNALNLTMKDVVQEARGTQRSDLDIQQGVLEESNVDLAAEMSELLLTQKSYQFNAKSISVADQMMGLVNGLRS
ncbi:flagellar hook-basal body protein [Bacillus songklensis]|uniref:Flagellar hook-basal body protein n=1 Tax=Bacillus songklensis TaxID=1069116 RepID=A0ABV8BB25_9BACI